MRVLEANIEMTSSVKAARQSKPNKVKPGETGSGKTRIQLANEEKILDAALELFSRQSVRGTSLDQIAEKAGLSKPNMLYYFSSKKALYEASLNKMLDRWLAPLGSLDPNGDPEVELGRYLDAKMDLSRKYPSSSRLFALEIIEGGESLRPLLLTHLKVLFDEKTNVLQTWIDDGRIRAIDPVHLIFSMWAITQHYADFDAQISMLTGSGISQDDFFERAKESTKSLIFRGCLGAE